MATSVPWWTLVEIKRHWCPWASKIGCQFAAISIGCHWPSPGTSTIIHCTPLESNVRQDNSLFSCALFGWSLHIVHLQNTVLRALVYVRANTSCRVKTCWAQSHIQWLYFVGWCVLQFKYNFPQIKIRRGQNAHHYFICWRSSICKKRNWSNLLISPDS